MGISDKEDENFIVFFDSRCLLCHRSVRWLLRHDRKARLRFAPLHSKTAHRLLPDEWQAKDRSDKEESLLYLAPHGFYSHSRAVFQILREVRSFWSWLRLFSILPVSWTDALYRWVARNRYRWFGKDENCPLPDPSHESRFLE